MAYPLKFKPIYKRRKWGDQKLHAFFGKDIPQGTKIGESWELADVRNNRSIIANGEFAGRTLRAVIKDHPEEITGDKKWASPIYTEYRPEIVRFYEDVYSVTDALGFCTFTGRIVHSNPKYMSEIFTAATGLPMSSEHLMLIGRRILTIEKCFNARQGANRKLDDLPYRMMHEPSPPGSRLEGVTNSPEELNAMLDRYYELHGWDSKTSWPYRKTLELLELEDIADELAHLGKLPK